MLMHVHHGLGTTPTRAAMHPAGQAPHMPDQEQPATGGPELAAVTHHRNEHHRGKHQQSGTGDAPHHLVDRWWQAAAGQHRSGAQGEHHRGMAERIHRAEAKPSPSIVACRDVGDRGDVVPVETVAQAEGEGGHQQTGGQPLPPGDSNHPEPANIARHTSSDVT